MSDRNTGKRRIVAMGNAGHCNSKIIKGLSTGVYYWSVQAIDNCFAGSPFAPEQVVAIPLPVELSSFKASAKNTDVILNWETATEVNNYGFEIERKKIPADAKEANWTKVGFVNGHGNSNSPKNYSFIDKNITGGTKFNYRLKQIDTDGKYEFSKEIEVEVTPKEYLLYQNYPNPFNPTTTIKFALPKNSHVIIKLFDVIGREVKTLVDEDKSAGRFEIQLDGTDLSNGVYFYRMESGKFISTKKFVLMK
jgi:hypothetical protein